MNQASQQVMGNQTESAVRLWALQPLVTKAVETDPQFQAAFISSPINAVRERFGAAAMPNEGEFLRRGSDGCFELVFPVTNVCWGFKPTNDELPDELLEHVSGGSPAYGPVNGYGVGMPK
jgi:hypothetical protein